MRRPLAIGAAIQRGALEDNLQNATAARQGDEMLAVILIVCAGVALLRVALGLAVRHGLWPRPTVSRRAAALLAGGLATAALPVGLASGGPDRLSNAWDDFKQPVGPASNSTAERFSSASGNGRYQYWSSALDAFSSKPVTGIGPGTYEYWWAENGGIPGFVREPTTSTSRRWPSSAFPAWRCCWRRSAASSWSGSASGGGPRRTSGPCSPPPSRRRPPS